MLKRMSLMLVGLFGVASYALAQDVPDPFPGEEIGLGVIEALIVPLTILFVWLARKVVPMLPGWSLPLLALVGPLLVNLLTELSGGEGLSPLLVALLGAAAVWVHSFFSRLIKLTNKGA